MLQMAVIVGSLRRESINMQLAKTLETLGADVMKFHYVSLADIPLYNQDDEVKVPAGVLAAKEIVAKADGVLVASPEYNRSIPGVLKNAIDWLSRPWGQNTWDKKPGGIVGISPSPVGTAVAQAELRNVLSVLGVRLLCRPEIYLQLTPGMYTEKGELAQESTRVFLRDYVQQLAAWVERMK